MEKCSRYVGDVGRSEALCTGVSVGCIGVPAVGYGIKLKPGTFATFERPVNRTNVYGQGIVDNGLIFTHNIAVVVFVGPTERKSSYQHRLLAVHLQRGL